MSRWITLACVLVVAIGAAAFVYQTLPEPLPDPAAEFSRQPAASEGPPPKLEVVGAKSYQFESLPLGGKDSHTWEFRNIGAGPLDVWLEETSCSCTVATLKSAEGEPSKRITIAPGKSAPIRVEWEGRKPTPRFGQSATLGTTDPDNRTVSLTVLGAILAPVEVRPSESITLPDAGPDDARRVTLTVVSFDRVDLKLTKIASSKPQLIVVATRPLPAEDLKKLKAKSGYELAVEVKPGLPTGRLSEDLLIDTDHPGRPSLKVTLTGNTVGPITVIPARIRMPSVAGVAGASQDITLVVRGQQETDFEVVSKSEKLKVAISRDPKTGMKGRYRMTVTVPPGTPAGLVDEPIVLKTSHPRFKEVRIPVSIFVSSRSETG